MVLTGPKHVVSGGELEHGQILTGPKQVLVAHIAVCFWSKSPSYVHCLTNATR